MSKQKVLICGATGFIGRNLVNRLSARDDLELHGVHWTRSAYDRRGVTWHRADLRDPATVEHVVAGMDVVVHAAATTSGSGDITTRPYIHITDNAVMTSLLLRSAFHHRVRHLVYFSCAMMYASRAEPWREDELRLDEPMEPRYFGAGWTKIYNEKMCEFFAGLGVTRHTVIRHTNIYGPFDKFDLAHSHVFGATVTKVMTSEDGTVSMWGTGEEARDLLYIDDLIEFVELALDKQKEPFALVNVGAGKATQLKALVQRIIDCSGRPLEIRHDLAKPSIPTSVTVDCGLAREVFGWRPAVDLDEGIRRTLAWWQANIGRASANAG